MYSGSAQPLPPRLEVTKLNETRTKWFLTTAEVMALLKEQAKIQFKLTDDDMQSIDILPVQHRRDDGFGGDTGVELVGYIVQFKQAAK